MITSTVTIVGTITADPELKRTRANKGVTNFTVAANPRRRNPETKEWEDGDAVFQKCTAWDDYAEAIAETIRKGDRVVVVGQLQASEWVDREGVKRSDKILIVDEIGVSPRYHSFSTSKRGSGKRADTSASNDGWATPGVSDEEPF